MSSWNFINHVKHMIMHKTLKDQHNINNSKLIHPLNTSWTKNTKDSSLHKFSQIIYFIQMFTTIQLIRPHIPFNFFWNKWQLKRKKITNHCLKRIEPSSSKKPRGMIVTTPSDIFVFLRIKNKSKPRVLSNYTKTLKKPSPQ
jgi:hypothetical protein